MEKKPCAIFCRRGEKHTALAKPYKKILSAVFSVSGKSYYRFRFRAVAATLSAPRVTCAKLQHFDCPHSSSSSTSGGSSATTSDYTYVDKTVDFFFILLPRTPNRESADVIVRLAVSSNKIFNFRPLGGS